MLNRIKEKLRQVKHNFAFIYFCLIMVIFLPNAIVLPSHSFRSAIVTAIGIDKSEQDFEVSVLAISDIDKTDMGENTKLISGKGQTVANAISNIEIQIGRKIKMGHVGYVAISQEVAQDNIVDILNALIISNKLSNTISIVMTNATSKQLLKQANKLEQSSSFKLREIIHNEFNESFVKDTKIDKFLQGYLSVTGVSTLGVVELVDDDAVGIDSSGGENSSQSGNLLSGNQQSSGGDEKNIIHFKNEHAVFKDGKLQFILTKQEMAGMNWIVENDLKNIITIQDVKVGDVQNAQISFELVRQKISSKVSYKNNFPIVRYNLSIVVDIAEINNANGSQFTEFTLTQQMKDKIESKIKSEISYTINSMREKQIDALGVSNILSSKPKAFSSFLEIIPDQQDFLSYIRFEVEVHSQLVGNK